MRLTVVGSGDAFGSGGRFNTCFWLDTAKGTLLVDFGASSLVALKAHGLDPNRIDIAYSGIMVCRDGVASSHDEHALAEVMADSHVTIECDLKLGGASAMVLTTDLSYAYIDENRRTS